MALELRRRGGHRLSAGRTVAILAILAVGVLLVAGLSPLSLPWTENGVTVIDVDAGPTPDTATVTYSRPGQGVRTVTIQGGEGTVVDPDADVAFVPKAAVPADLHRAIGDHDAGVGSVGPWAVLGRLSVARVTIGGNDVRVVAPTNGTVDPARKAYFLQRFVDPYVLDSGAPERITIYAGPRGLPGVGRMYPDDTGYLTQEGFWDGEVESVWIHEYVHARQNMDLTEEMRWFEEASAVYLSLRMMEEQYDPVTDRDVDRWLAALPDGEDVPLANRSAWGETHTDYNRGVRVVAAIDERVRAATDGNHTIVSVLRHMNAAEEPIGIEQFVAILEEHTGGEADWVRERITESPAGGSTESITVPGSVRKSVRPRSRRPGPLSGARYRNHKANPTSDRTVRS